MSSRTAIITAAALLAMLVATLFLDVYSTTEFTCLECRANLTKKRIYGVPISRITRHPYTTTYLASEPNHKHSWCWCGTRHSWSLLRVTRACGRRHPIWSLPIDIQAEYSRLVPASEMDATLRDIDSSDREKANAAADRAFERVINSR
jgi:hypothetical protein